MALSRIHQYVCTTQQQHSSMCLDHCLHFKVLHLWALLVSCPPTAHSLSLFPVSISNISIMAYPIKIKPPQQDKLPHFLRVKSESITVSYFINFQLSLPSRYLIALLYSFVLIIKLPSCSRLTLTYAHTYVWIFSASACSLFSIATLIMESCMLDQDFLGPSFYSD